MTCRILAFGDSLTWGLNPGAGRHRHEDRWTSVIEELVPDVQVIAEGLPGRTTCFDDWSDETDRNGAHALPGILRSHDRLDLVIIMLGTNDLKPDLCGRAEGAAAGIERLVEIVADFPFSKATEPPMILVVSPPHCGNRTGGDGLPARGRSIEQSCKLAALYDTVAKRNGCCFFDAATIATASPIDGVHLDAGETRALGKGLAPLVRDLLQLRLSKQTVIQN